MGNQFAKLFERGGEQVVMLKSTHEETDAPSLTFIMSAGGVEIKTQVSFKDSDTGLETRDAAFDTQTEEGAFGMRTKLIAQLGGLAEEDPPTASTRSRKPR